MASLNSTNSAYNNLTWMSPTFYEMHIKKIHFLPKDVSMRTVNIVLYPFSSTALFNSQPIENTADSN